MQPLQAELERVQEVASVAKTAEFELVRSVIKEPKKEVKRRDYEAQVTASRIRVTGRNEEKSYCEAEKMWGAHLKNIELNIINV